jgi:hypothetical protein
MTAPDSQDELVSPCCGSGIKRAFYGGLICSACRSEVSL